MLKNNEFESDKGRKISLHFKAGVYVFGYFLVALYILFICLDLLLDILTVHIAGSID